MSICNLSLLRRTVVHAIARFKDGDDMEDILQQLEDTAADNGITVHACQMCGRYAAHDHFIE